MILKKKNRWELYSGIVRKFMYGDLMMRRAHKGLFGGGRYFVVIFESEYMRIFSEDINVHSEKLTSDIISLKNPFLQAFVRFCISHQNLKMPVNDVLAAIGVEKSSCSARYVRKRRAELRKHKEALQKKFGIMITDTHVIYSQHEYVWFTNPRKGAELS